MLRIAFARLAARFPSSMMRQAFGERLTGMSDVVEVRDPPALMEAEEEVEVGSQA